MSNSIKVLRQKIQRLTEEKKAQTVAEITRQKNQALIEAAQAKEEVLKLANRQIKNAAFQHIYVVFNNMIYRVDPDENLKPIIYTAYSTKNSAALEAYEKDLKEFQDKEKSLKKQLDRAAGRLLHFLKGHILFSPWSTFRSNRNLETLYKNSGFSPGRLPNISGIGFNAVNPVIREINEIERKRLRLVSPIPPAIQDGSAQKPAVADILVDLDAGKKGCIYWARWAAPFRIVAADLETKEIYVLIQRAAPVTSLALTGEKGNRQLFWMEGNQKIYKGSLRYQSNSEPPISLVVNEEDDEKKEVIDITAPDRGGLWQMEIDHVHQMIFWTNDISIWRSKFDGSHNEMVISPGESPFPIDLAVDGKNGYLYWIDKDLKMIRRSDLNGIIIEDLYPLNVPTKGLKVDPVSNILYWSDQTIKGHRLMRGDAQDRAITLNGVNEYIDMGNIPGVGNTFSVELVLNPQATDKQAFLVQKSNDDNNPHFIIGHYNKKIAISINGKQVTTGTALTGYQHLTLVFEEADGKTNVQVFRNGELLTVEEAQGTFQIAAVLGGQSGLFWNFGANWSNGEKSDFFKGTIREMRIWNKALQHADILNNLQERISSNHPDLLAIWQTSRRLGPVIPENSGKAPFALIQSQEFHQWGISLDGGQSQLTLPSIKADFSEGISISFWLFRAGADSKGLLLHLEEEHSSFQIELALNETDQLVLSTKDNNTLKLLTTPLTFSGYWIHITISVSSAGKASIFQNGKEQINGHLHSLPANFVPSKIIMGKVGDQAFKGGLSELRLWNLVRSETDIQQHLHRRLSGQEEGLVGYWLMATGNGNIITSQVSKSHEGKLGRAIWNKAVLPIQAPIPTTTFSTESDEILSVPGLESISLVYKNEFALAQRKKAYERLSQAQAESRRQLEEAEALTRQKIQQTREEKAAQMALEEQKKQASLAAARAIKMKKKEERRTEQEKAAQKIADAQTEKRQRIAKANGEAKTRRDKATSDAATIKNSAQNKKAAAKADYDNAKRKMG